jgi:7 transmembrane receptor (rhodopsin family)
MDKIGQVRDDPITASRRRVARLLIVVAVLFASSWLPYHAVSLYFNFVKKNEPVSLAVLSVALLLGHSQSAQNPIVYCIMSTTFRRAMISALHCRRPCLVREVKLVKLNTDL